MCEIFVLELPSQVFAGREQRRSNYNGGRGKGGRTAWLMVRATVVYYKGFVFWGEEKT